MEEDLNLGFDKNFLIFLPVGAVFKLTTVSLLKHVKEHHYSRLTEADSGKNVISLNQSNLLR